MGDSSVNPVIQFTDGANYERFMGAWSQRVGDPFLDWLNVDAGQRWLDVGCGNGAFTERLLTRAAPSAACGIDVSAQQLAFARTRSTTPTAQYALADAMALPFVDAVFDVAVMPLVIFFVPEPSVGVAQMARVVRSGGLVTAYAWDIDGGGFPYAALHDEMIALGLRAPAPPSADASSFEVMTALWADAGLVDVRTTVITVQRTFATFDDYWTTVLQGPRVGPTLEALPGDARSGLKDIMLARLPVATDGSITLDARANAIAGRVL